MEIGTPCRLSGADKPIRNKQVRGRDALSLVSYCPVLGFACPKPERLLVASSPVSVMRHYLPFVSLHYPCPIRQLGQVRRGPNYSHISNLEAGRILTVPSLYAHGPCGFYRRLQTSRFQAQSSSPGENTRTAIVKY
jgi:hypothetical protein